jgi:hypothetical protein
VRRAASVLLALLAGGRGTAADVEPVGPIAVVVGTSSPIRDVTIDGLREVYLRRRRIWSDGTPSLPVNLPADHPVRRAFSRRVLGRLPEDLESHWSRLAFDGIRPPTVLQTAQAVCAYVAVEPSAMATRWRAPSTRRPVGSSSVSRRTRGRGRALEWGEGQRVRVRRQGPVMITDQLQRSFAVTSTTRTLRRGGA